MQNTCNAEMETETGEGGQGSNPYLALIMLITVEPQTVDEDG